jgi:hypothetical protein
MSDSLKPLLERLDLLEKRIDELDHRTIGHVRFGPTKHSEAETAARQRAAVEKIIEKIVPPADRSQVCLTDGEPVADDHRELKDNGQQKGYVVLTESERKRGFIRPVRSSYKHVGLSQPANQLRDLTDEESERYKRFNYMKYEKYPDDSTIVGKYWTTDELAKIGNGCRGLTRMGHALAETYARDPKFYSGTFCVGCGKHFPVDEFVWEGTNERVGS